MNGMRQGLIIGAVAGLFFGFMLGRYGVQQAGRVPALGSLPTQESARSDRGQAVTGVAQLPKNYLRPEQLKDVKWDGLKGQQLAWAVKVLNEVPCQCQGRKYTLAQCVRSAHVCKPNMKTVSEIMGLIRQGVHYTRVLARFSPQPSYQAQKIGDIKAFLAKTARYPVPVGNGPVFGSNSALVTVVEFSDFQCPYCSRAANTVKKLVELYPGRVRVVFRHHPLSFHKQAHLAAQASMVAHEYGKFWKYHDILFANMRNLQKPYLLSYARQLGIPEDAMKKALDSGKYKKHVDEDNALAARYAEGTPTFLLNGRRLVGALPLEQFRRVVDEEIQVAQYLLDRGVKRTQLYDRLLEEGKKAAAEARQHAEAEAKRRQEEANRRVNVPVGQSPTWGPAQAKVTVVEFSDFQCPFCSRGAAVVEQIKKAYPGRVRVVFKHLPLYFHAQAHIAAQASMAAHEQGKFWEYHDKLFANYRNINKDNLVKWADELKLDMAKFKTALDNGTYKKHVDDDLALARQVGARGTPTFFVNGKRIVGAQPFSEFKSLIDQELSGPRRIVPTLDRFRVLKPLRPNIGTIRIAPRTTPGTSPVDIKDAPSWGPANAPVWIVEYSDFECPFCTRGANTVEEIKKAYKGKVRIFFKHLPLSFHQNAHLAAQASMAAHEQGKFWEYHDKLFQNQRNLQKPDLINYAKELGLNVAKFTEALDKGTYRSLVDNDLIQASRVGAQGTPTFFVNGERVVGAQPFYRFKEVIEKAMGNTPALAPIPSLIPTPTPSVGPAPVNTIAVGNSPSWGPSDAKVTVVEFSDFECPFCTRGANTMDEVKRQYKGQSVRIVFKHMPLSFHRNAHLAAQASMAAHAQGKFWEYHDKLFKHQRNMQKPDLINYAKELGLDVAKFTEALDKGTYKAAVDADMQLAGSVGANGTPTFVVNGHKIVGAQPFFRFKAAIDAVLAGKAIPSDEPAPRRPTRARGPVKIDTKGAPSWGPENAKITVVAFSDFECPFCSRGANTLEEIKKAYKGQVRIVFKHLPLSFHRNAHIAAQASMAAHEQGKFWEYHDKLFANMRNINKDNLVKWADELKLDTVQFKAALDTGKFKSYVDKDATEAGSVGANGTPTFFVNGQSIVGAQPFSRFKGVIDALLSGKPVPSDAPSPQPSRPSGPVKINTAGAPSWGPSDAKVTIVEFSDFECPFCSRGANTIDQLKKDYAGKIRVVFKHLPLSFHKNAHIAAQASMAAHEQGKFWEYHDKLFANMRNINKDNLVKWADELKLDMAQFKAALDTGKFKSYVDKDATEAGSIGANGTPTFFINGYSLVGAQPIFRFKSMIDAALAGKAMPSEPSRQAPTPPSGPIKIAVGHAPTWGPANAPVTIIEFSDFECPFCTRGANAMKQIKETYGDKVRIAFKHLPLSFHKNAHLAAQASMAAHEQGKFWEYHDKLFANYRNINKDNLVKWADELKLDMAKFKTALDTGKFKNHVDADATLAGSVGANGTPTFFVNGNRIVGAQPFTEFKRMVDAELQKVRK